VGILNAQASAPRPRAFVRVAGPAAEDYLERMLSNSVVSLAPGEARDALLLTAKARVIAPLRVLRRGPEDFLLLTEPELGEVVRSELLRSRFAARAEIELEHHDSYVLFGAAPGEAKGLAIATPDYGVPALEVIDGEIPPGVRLLSDDELEELRIRAGTPRFGREIDERVLPAEAGLVERAVSLEKGCYPGQEPVARLHYRGHVNRELRILLLEDGKVPAPEATIEYEGKTVGRVTSAVGTEEGVLALAYVRVDVPADAELGIGSGKARSLPRDARVRPLE
jgi:tRNA-modifying protein YgfZ